MKKILIVCQHYHPEPFRISDIADYFITNKIEVDVLCGIPNYPGGHFYDGYSWFKKRSEIYNEVNITRSLEIPRGKNKNFNIFMNFISFPFFAMFQLPKFLFKKYDKILIYQLSPILMALPGIILGKLKRIETTMCVLDFWPENLFSVLDIKNKFLHKLAYDMSIWHYKKVDKLVMLTKAAKSLIIERTNKKEEDVIEMPQCCEKFYEFDIFDEKLATRFKDGFNIVFAGSINPTQDFSTLLYAAQMLQNDGIYNINWIIVGDGMSREWLEAEVARLGLYKFFFEGFVPAIEIPKYHTIADALIACWVKCDIIKYAVAAKIMSYIAAGRPIILAMDGAAQDIVKNAECGLAGDSEDKEMLYKNIKQMYSMSKEERDNMGKQGREYHFKYFERDSNLKRLKIFMWRNE